MCTGSLCGVARPAQRERGLGQRQARRRAAPVRPTALWPVRRRGRRRACCGRRRKRSRCESATTTAATTSASSSTPAVGEPAHATTPGGLRAALTAHVGGQERRSAHRVGGLRSAPTMPTPSSTRMKTTAGLASVTPCSATAVNVRKAKPAMNTSAATSTSGRSRGSAAAGGRDHGVDHSRLARSGPLGRRGTNSLITSRPKAKPPMWAK